MLSNHASESGKLRKQSGSIATQTSRKNSSKAISLLANRSEADAQDGKRPSLGTPVNLLCCDRKVSQTLLWYYWVWIFNRLKVKIQITFFASQGKNEEEWRSQVETWGARGSKWSIASKWAFETPETLWTQPAQIVVEFDDEMEAQLTENVNIASKPDLNYKDVKPRPHSNQ